MAKRFGKERVTSFNDNIEQKRRFSAEYFEWPNPHLLGEHKPYSIAYIYVCLSIDHVGATTLYEEFGGVTTGHLGQKAREMSDGESRRR